MAREQHWVNIPLERSPLGLLQVAATIDGRPVVLLVDTGANATVLDRARATHRGFAGAASGRRAVGCMGAGGVDLLDVRLDIGDVTVDPFRFSIIDLGHVNQQLEASGSAPVDGVLGADVLATRSAVIRYSEPELRLLAG